MGRKHIPLARQNVGNSGDVVVLRAGVDSLIKPVKEIALELAAGDVLRIEVINPETAIVLNNSIDLRSIEKTLPNGS